MIGRVALIGFMGSGKTTVGALLAARLGAELVDTDRVIEERTGLPVSRIFAESGEPAFRALETAVLDELRSRQGIVVATGGGAPLQSSNRPFFEATPDTFHLRVGLATARARASAGGATRPLLSRDEAAVRRLYEERQSVYEELGRPVETEGCSPADVAREILRLLEDPTATAPGESGA